jgi:hypothetical protein
MPSNPFAAVTEECRVTMDRLARGLETRRRLRRLISRVDDTVRCCEELHLCGLRYLTEELATQAEDMLREARQLLDDVDLNSAGHSGGRPRRTIQQLMDQLWMIQDSAFDQLIPWRRELGDNEESGGKGESAAGAWSGPTTPNRWPRPERLASDRFRSRGTSLTRSGQR